MILGRGKPFTISGPAAVFWLLAAAGLGAAQVTGVDIDPVAVAEARRNVKRKWPGRYGWSRGNLLENLEPGADLVVINIIADIIINVLPGLPIILKPGGRVIASGIILSRAHEVKEAVRLPAWNTKRRLLKRAGGLPGREAWRACLSSSCPPLPALPGKRSILPRKTPGISPVFSGWRRNGGPGRETAGVYAYRVLLRTVTPQLVAGEILAKEADESEPALRIHLYQSLLKGRRWTGSCKRGLKSGFSLSNPFLSSRSVARPEPAQAGKKQQRWSRIALEAAKQSERGSSPPSIPWQQSTLCRGRPGCRPWWPGRGAGKEPPAGFSGHAQAGGVDPGRRAGGRVCPGRGGILRGPRRPPRLAGPPRSCWAETAGPVTAALILYHYGEM